MVLYAAGRTDKGVHALGQVISFRTESRLPIERWALAVNSSLPHDVSVAQAEEAAGDFHARFSARSRTYGYLIWTRRSRSALWGRYSLHVRRPLNVAAMRVAAESLVGQNDFRAYARRGGNPGPTTVRNLHRISIRVLSNGSVLVLLTANAFLRAMVRNIIGVLVEIGVGDLPPQAAREILEMRDRVKNPCPPAAAHGLCLMRVDY